MKSLNVYYLTIIFIFLYKQISFNFKFNFYVNALNMKNTNSFPHTELKIATDQNFVNWNSDSYDKEKFYDFVHKNNEKGNFLQTNSEKIEKFLNSSSINENTNFYSENYAIKTIDTSILVKQNQTNGIIKEKILFELNEGKFKQIVRKISLQSSSGKFSNFKLSS
jgi:hypothetical protein